MPSFKFCAVQRLSVINENKQKKCSHAFLHKKMHKKSKIVERTMENMQILRNVRRTIYWRMILFFLKYIAGTILAIWNCGRKKWRLEGMRMRMKRKRSFVLSRIKDVNILLVKWAEKNTKRLNKISMINIQTLHWLASVPLHWI